ncbi:hypothetical protein KAJ77_11185 [bacterium]|nr:hypothetical protein [bacterium]
MKISINEIEQKAEQALKEALSGVPFLKILSVQRGLWLGRAEVDLMVQVDTGQGEKCLTVELKSNGQPRFARNAVNSLLNFRNMNPQCYCIFMAPYISEQAAAICMDKEMGYVDLAGNCYLAFDRVFIERQGRDNPFSEKRELRTLFSPKAERILRVLLENPGRKWKVNELVDEADVSQGQVSNVKRLLADRDWVTEEYGGFELIEPLKLLDEWSGKYTYQKSKVFKYYSLMNMAEVEESLAQYCRNNSIRFALTGFSGAARIKPVVKYQRAFAYIQSAMEGLVTELNFKKVDSGENVILLEPYDEGVFYRSEVIDQVPVACPTQLYLDLKSYRGRGEESAEALFREVIQNRW